MSFAFEFDRPDDEYFFAYSFPYTYTDVQRCVACRYTIWLADGNLTVCRRSYLHDLDARKLPFYRRELLCKTVQNRRYDGAVPPASDRVPPSQFNA